VSLPTSSRPGTSSAAFCPLNTGSGASLLRDSGSVRVWRYVADPDPGTQAMGTSGTLTGQLKPFPEPEIPMSFRSSIARQPKQPSI